MKTTVIFMRHGKAADGFEYDEDFERPLENRGKKEVKEAAEALKKEGIIPDLVIASPAFRTASTARIASGTLGLHPDRVVYKSELYMHHREDYLNVLKEFIGKVILIAGHNPFVGEWSMHFSRGEIQTFPTSSLAVFSFSDSVISRDSPAELIWFRERK